MKHSNKKILIATGGTGGHIFPSLSLADFLKRKHGIGSNDNLFKKAKYSLLSLLSSLRIFFYGRF